MIKRWLSLAICGVVLALAPTQAAGFSLRGAFKLAGNGPFVAAEAGYSDKLSAEIEIGGRLGFDGETKVILPYVFAEYRRDLHKEGSATIQVVSRGELGLGYAYGLSSIVPRLQFFGGIDARYPLGGIEAFGQARATFDFIPTNRLKPGVSGRFGAILIPFVPFVGTELSYNFLGGVFDSNFFAGTLLYLSPQFNMGLEAGSGSNGYVRLFAQFEER